MDRETLFRYRNRAIKRLRENFGINIKPLPPQWVAIEVTSACNLRCVMCDIAKVKRGAHHMEFELFTKIIDELAKFAPYASVECQHLGEPLLHPRFMEMVRYAVSKGLRIGTNTNGTLLNNERMKALVDAGFNNIAISIDAFSREIYEEIRKGGDYDKVMENALNFYRYRRDRGLTTPSFSVTFVDQDVNHHELDAFVDFWVDKADYIYSQRVYFHGALDKKSSLNPDRKRIPCPHLWRSMIISSIGEVTTCPPDDHFEMKVGDTRSQKLRDIWYGKPYLEMRKAHMKNNFLTYPMCEKCDVWRGNCGEGMPVVRTEARAGKKVQYMENELYRAWKLSNE